ncbi:sigma-70 family RNA polymerase sigma factor [Rhizomonospora bruguierae]|uniref:sigma-70 family RNA polymerase sigma factor n=1 Tax=Rhizomonospora bruguierae TaxID=1581705 RepID=UPI001BCDECF6|nr:sigma-70 family RNA polymerase sigma factor [Micromonospora sp. NBRC 107566]
MEEPNWLAERFEAHRARLRAVALRMLGSTAEAEDAVQETWLRLSRVRPGEVENLAGWLTTVTARVCLDMLRARAARKENPLESVPASVLPDPGRGVDPEQEALTADAVGLALLVVLDRLTPAERIAFVLHDMFDVPFAEIAAIVGRTPVAAKKLASRARIRVRGGTADHADLIRRWELVEAFLAAIRDGDLRALLALLDPEVVRRADRWVITATEPAEIRGARTVAEGTLRYARTATRFGRLALIDGAPGLVVAPQNQLRIALTMRIENDRIVEIEVIGEPGRLAELAVSLPQHSSGGAAGEWEAAAGGEAGDERRERRRSGGDEQ